MHNVGYGYFDNDLAIFMPVDRITENLIYRVDISCAIPFTVVGAIDKSILDIAWDWMNYAIGIVDEEEFEPVEKCNNKPKYE